MSPKAKASAKKLSNGHSPKRSRQQTTSVGRVVKKLEQALKYATTAEARLRRWEGLSTEDSRAMVGALSAAAGNATGAMRSLEGAMACVGKLQQASWEPPKALVVTVYKEGDGVKINDKYQATYLQLYPKAVVNRLVVTKVLETGQLVVKAQGKDKDDSSAVPFMVKKSHLERRHEV